MAICPFRDNHRCEDCMLHNLNTRRCAFVSIALAQEQLVVLHETANRAAAGRIAAHEAIEPPTQKPYLFTNCTVYCSKEDVEPVVVASKPTKSNLCLHCIADPDSGAMCALKDWDYADTWGFCPGWDKCDIPSKREKA